MTLFLNPLEIEQLTCRRRHDAQVRALRGMGIDHKVRPDGSVAVLKAHIEKIFGGETEKHVRVKTIEPNWNAL